MTYTDTQKQQLLAVATAVDALVGDLPQEVTDYPALPSFREDMTEALSGVLVFTVADVLDAMHNWSVMAVRSWTRG